MITALIVDDEGSNRQMLQMLLRDHCPVIGTIHEAADIETAYSQIITLRPELVFLDIRLPGKSGFDLLKMFTRIDFEVVFVTAYDRYAIRAFEFNAIDYIIKPISVPRLLNAMDRVVERMKTSTRSELVLHFVKTITDGNELSQKLSVHDKDKVRIIDVSEIASIKTEQDHTTITLVNKARYYSSKDLVKFESLLQGMPNFIRITKSVIVNVFMIKSYSKGEPFVIELKNDEVFEVSRRRKSEVLKHVKAQF